MSNNHEYRSGLVWVIGVVLGLVVGAVLGARIHRCRYDLRREK